MTTTDTTGHRALEEAIDDSSATEVSRKKLATKQEELLVSEIVLTFFTIIKYILMYSFLWMHFGERSTLFKAFTIFHMADVSSLIYLIFIWASPRRSRGLLGAQALLAIDNFGHFVLLCHEVDKATDPYDGVVVQLCFTLALFLVNLILIVVNMGNLYDFLRLRDKIVLTTKVRKPMEVPEKAIIESLQRAYIPT
ncbi:hypothetical protein C7M61_003217 [Candidozyma pseudohaemuli]|uniref:Uncharacterized protein n=1 Tax=Candidozyma pseudohaemuli TaxID=418784 RepID=A0A2P7YPS5_9ASCO|nr:hypothetical protein C7M61_003217 [[Candida] pseudohaemulonii]PSK37966.1 hypothetical protein C7M61_003217 [[Candida] pseudohaemulonii]